jgi:hypothetical protein
VQRRWVAAVRREKVERTVPVLVVMAAVDAQHVLEELELAIARREHLHSITTREFENDSSLGRRLRELDAQAMMSRSRRTIGSCSCVGSPAQLQNRYRSEPQHAVPPREAISTLRQQIRRQARRHARPVALFQPDELHETDA